MENFDFDDMLRYGLSHTPSDARFEFKEEYWLQAKALLDADMRRQKRRRVLGYAFMLTMLLVPAVAIYWQMQPMAPAKATPQTIPTQEMAQQQPMPGNTPLSAKTGVPNDKMGQIFKKAGNDATQSNVTASKIQIPSKTQSTADSIANTFLQSTGNLTNNNRPPQNNQIENETNQSGSSLSLHAAPFLTSISYRPASPSEDNLLSVPYRNTLGVLPTSIAAPNSMSAAALPKFSLFTVAPTREAIPVPLITHKHDDKPFEMGLVASLSTPSGLFFEEQLGMALGAAARYRIYKKIYLGADLLWRRNSGNQNIGAYAVAEFSNSPGASTEDAQVADLIQQSNSTDYSFGYTNTQINSAVRAIHQIELPLSVQIQWRRFALESGLSLSTRLLARRVTEQYTQSSLMPRSTQISKDSYFESYSDNTPRINTRLMGGLHWQPFKHWRVGCRVNWSLLENSGIQYRNSGFDQTYQKNVLNVTQKRAIIAELRTAYLF